MANIDTLTTNYSLPVPELENTVVYDMPRIKSALTTIDTTLFAKQDKLASGTSIKTVNGSSLLGSGDISVSGGGGGLTTTSSITANYTATVSELVRCDTTSGAFNVTLPASPADGSIIAFLDISNTFGIEGKQLSVLPNTGKTIESDATSLVLDITGTYVSFVFNSDSSDWRLLETPSLAAPASAPAVISTGGETNISGILSGNGSVLSGVTLKTINGNALVGSGNITVAASSVLQVVSRTSTNVSISLASGLLSILTNSGATIQVGAL